MSRGSANFESSKTDGESNVGQDDNLIEENGLQSRQDIARAAGDGRHDLEENDLHISANQQKEPFTGHGSIHSFPNAHASETSAQDDEIMSSVNKKFIDEYLVGRAAALQD